MAGRFGSAAKALNVERRASSRSVVLGELSQRVRKIAPRELTCTAERSTSRLCTFYPKI